MNRIATAVIICAVLLASCGSAGVKNETVGRKLSVVHSVTYGHKGTKSESESGSLSINGIPVPDLFSAVEADGKLYTFRTRTRPWGCDGYFPADEGAASVFDEGSASAGKDDLARGWYEPGRKGGLPSGWILVKWNGGSAAVSPEKIMDLVSAKSLKQIPRAGMLREKPLR